MLRLSRHWLPSTIGALTGLQDLTIADCTFLEELPPSIMQLTSLRQLHLSYLCTIKTLTSTIGVHRAHRPAGVEPECSKLFDQGRSKVHLIFSEALKSPRLQRLSVHSGFIQRADFTERDQDDSKFHECALPSLQQAAASLSSDSHVHRQRHAH
jgi:hypothetical protein